MTGDANNRRFSMNRQHFAGAAGASVLAAANFPSRAFAQTGTADLDTLIKAAKGEGNVVVYSGATANVIQRVSEAFSAKYGIKIDFLRLGGGPLLQRYSTEAEAGNFGADLIFVAGGGTQFSIAAAPKGWIVPLTDIPAAASHEFPSRFMLKSSALIQIGPWLIAYNSDKLKGEEIPKDWPDLLAPRFKGQILMPDLHSTDAVVQFWAALADQYGDAFLAGIKAQTPRFFSDAVPALQGLGAGEGLIQIPIVAAAVSAMTAKGAPIGTFTPDYTTGVEMQVMLTNPAKAKHPNAARLLANYVMSKEGNAVFNADAGSVGIYDTAHLPKHYVSPMADVSSRKEHLIQALGS